MKEDSTLRIRGKAHSFLTSRGDEEWLFMGEILIEGELLIEVILNRSFPTRDECIEAANAQGKEMIGVACEHGLERLRDERRKKN